MSNFVEEFTKQKEKLKNIAYGLYKENFLSEKELKQIDEILTNEKIKIAVIGQMKYGKSTFINSLIFNKEFLPTSSTPMTAALSEIIYGNIDKYKITFFTQEEFEEMEKGNSEVFKDTITKAKKLGRELYRLLGETKIISPEEFEEYVGAEGKYTPIVKMLTIETPNDILKESIVVDTPGFNDPIKSRDEIAFKFIEEADFIILFLYAGRPFDNTDRQIIIDKLQNAPLGKLIAVVNKSDTLLEEQGTFERIKRYVEEKYKTTVKEGITSPNLREMLLKAEIIPISSLMALLGKMDIREIEKDENLKWYYDKFSKEFGNISQKDMLELSNINTLEQSIKNAIEKEKNKILTNKVKQQIITSLRIKLDKLQTEKLSLEQDLSNLNNIDEIENKKKIIDQFMNNEFNEIINTYKILESIKYMSDNLKKQDFNKIHNFENSTFQNIKILVDKLGKKEGVERLKYNFRQFNAEITEDLRKHISICLEDMQQQVKNKIDEIFEELKHHELGTKFDIKSADFDRLKENFLFLQLDSIDKQINNIKLELPTVDTGLVFGLFGDSKEKIKDKFSNFSTKYFNNLREEINKIYNSFDAILFQQLGNNNELNKFLKQKIISPLENSLYKIEQERDNRLEKINEIETKLEYINKNLNIIENKIAEVENELKG